MSRMMYCNAPRERGLVLVSALLLLLVATILALSMFRSVGTQERIAGNLREKERALHSAETAQQFAEWWLQSATATKSVNCKDPMTSTAGQPGQTCTNVLPTPTSLPWAFGVTYVPPDPMNGSMAMTGANGPTNGTYFSAPQFYISDLGTGAGGEVYQIDAVGYGGTQNAVAVVESTYVVTTSGHCPDPNLIC